MTDSLKPAGKLVVVHGGSGPNQYRDVLQALDSALTIGADGFELDVRRTRDGRLVVHHDETIGERWLKDLPYDEAANEARRLGYSLPLFTEVIDRLRQMSFVDVEMKEAGYEREILQALRTAGVPNDCLVMTSFEQSALDGIHAADRSIRTGLLVYDCTGAEALALFAKSGAAFLGPDHEILDGAALEQAATRGVRLLPWTVNNPAAMSRLLAADAVAGVITDRGAEALRVRGALASGFGDSPH